MTIPAADLNAVRSRILQNARRGNAKPSNPSQQVLVDRQGRLHQGEQTPGGQRRRLSQVPQDTFSWGIFRRGEEADTVANKMPPDTQLTTIGDTEGYLYGFYNEFGEYFIMFAFYKGAGKYGVLVVSPEVENRYRDIDKTHLYPDATICLNRTDNVHTLEDAYAKSVIWANGWTAFERTGYFQFSPDG